MKIQPALRARAFTCRVALMLATFVTVSFFATRAGAVTNDYDGYNCLPAIANDPNITYDSVNGGIKASAQSDIICEIVKTTSYPATPANTSDKITDIEVSINNNGMSTGIFCAVQVYSSFAPSSGTNATSDTVSHRSVTANTSISFPSGLTTTNWWGSSSSWHYAQLECTLPGGTEMNSYSVTEQGTDNAFHIYPAWSLCSPADSTTATANLTYTLGVSQMFPSGFLAAPGGGSEFFYSCYLPGASAQFSITPADNMSSGWQWSYSYYGSSSCSDGDSPCDYPSDCWSPDNTGCRETGSANSNETWPSKLFPGTSTDLPVPSADEVSGTGFTNFLDSSTFYYAYFWQIQGNGDMEILSMRTTGDFY